MKARLTALWRRFARHTPYGCVRCGRWPAYVGLPFCRACADHERRAAVDSLIREGRLP